MKQIWFLLFFAFAKCSSGSNILVLESLASPSHHIWIASLTKELAALGHNITSITSDVDSKKTENIHYLHLNGVYESYNATIAMDMINVGDMNPWVMLMILPSYWIDTCKTVINSTGYKQLLNYPKDFKFDLVMYDYITHPCLLPFVHQFNYPSLMGITALGGGLSFTAPFFGSTFDSHIPFAYHNEIKDTFLWRVNNFLLHMVDYALKKYHMSYSYEKIVKPHFPGMPTMSDIERKTKLVLINCHPFYEAAEAMLPNVIPTGAMQVQNAKPLPKEIQTILDGSPNGIIYFALGSNMRSDKLGDVRLTHILEAFRSLPQYTFLWKFESDKLPVAVPNNVHIRAWTPQNDLLANANVKLFISHCGLLSTQEAIWHSVPLLGLPIFVDQFLNLKKSVEIGIAEGYSIRELNNVTFAAAIKHARENKILASNMERFSKSFRDQPETPMERAVWWTEWLMRNPDSATYLRNPAMDLNVFQRQEIDIILFLAFVALMSLGLCFKVVRYVVKRFSKKVSKNNKKKKN